MGGSCSTLEKERFFLQTSFLNITCIYILQRPSKLNFVALFHHEGEVIHIYIYIYIYI
jgi:hypothetical protein